ncbi:MAG: hypothetical protein WCJ01_00030 [Ignavibacteria bacterium]
MYSSVNRHMAIIKPKAPFLHWLTSVSPEDTMLTLEDIRQDSTGYMIPAHDLLEQDYEFVKSIYPDIFEMQLEEWAVDVELWPAELTFELFKEWFEVYIHSTIIDICDEAIEKEGFST